MLRSELSCALDSAIQMNVITIEIGKNPVIELHF